MQNECKDKEANAETWCGTGTERRAHMWELRGQCDKVQGLLADARHQTTSRTAAFIYSWDILLYLSGDVRCQRRIITNTPPHSSKTHGCMTNAPPMQATRPRKRFLTLLARQSSFPRGLLQHVFMQHERTHGTCGQTEGAGRGCAIKSAATPLQQHAVTAQRLGAHGAPCCDPASQWGVHAGRGGLLGQR